jgi:hypothetical protein
MPTEIIEKSFDQERALYHLENAEVNACRFEGPADGESCLKEARNIEVSSCFFALRYPLWHVEGLTLKDSTFTLTARAALWYDAHGEISNVNGQGIKALRECEDISLKDCTFNSEEFGWKCRRLHLDHCSITSEYAFLDSDDVVFDESTLQSKYAFQYMKNLNIHHSHLITKDSFWHSVNVVVEDSVIEGEYLGWFSDHLTLRRCKIKGTQPFCYCQHLILEDCELENCDLAFEYSDVEASIKGHVDSIKNPKSGHITLDSVGEIIRGNTTMPCSGEVIIRKK